MKKITMLSVMATLCFFLSVNAQSQNQQTTTTSSLAGYTAKLVILDFWATWCSSCINAFPKMELLQKEFTGKVQFVKVTSEAKAKALPFLEKLYAAHPSVIPVITDDTLYSKRFPHMYLPHYVWLDENRKLLATTAEKEVTAANINTVLRTGKFETEQKVDLKADKLMFLDTNLLNNHLVSHYSLLFKGDYSGIASGATVLRSKAGKQNGIVLRNMPLASMYRYMANYLFRLDGDSFNEKRQLLLLKNLAPFITGGNLDPAELYTFIWNVPEISEGLLFKTLLADLNRYTEYSANIEKRARKCYVLKRIDNVDRLKSKGGMIRNTLFNNSSSQLINGPLHHLIIRMGELPCLDLPVVDETGYTGNIDITIANYKTFELLTNELKAYGLGLSPAIRDLNMFVIRDK